MSYIHANSVFNTLFAVGTRIAFNPDWCNSTGYFNYAVNAVLPGEDKIFSFITPMPNNRRGVIIKTEWGNVVIFERYTNGANGVYVSNTPRGLNDVFQCCHSQLSGDQMLYMSSWINRSATTPWEKPWEKMDLALVSITKDVTPAVGAIPDEDHLCTVLHAGPEGCIMQSMSNPMMYLLCQPTEEHDYSAPAYWKCKRITMIGKQGLVNEQQCLAALVA